MGLTKGQPASLQPWFAFWTNLQHPAINFWVSLVAILETLIALALILGFARKVTYLAATVFSLLIWSTAEGFGGPYTGGATDVGTGIIHAVVFMGLLALSTDAGPAWHSLDRYLEKRIAWWWKVAEVRRPQPVAQAAPAHPAA